MQEDVNVGAAIVPDLGLVQSTRVSRCSHQGPLANTVGTCLKDLGGLVLSSDCESIEYSVSSFEMKIPLPAK